MLNLRPSEYVTDQREYPTCADLFCGAGGLSLGFCQAGGLPVAAVDNHRDSVETYRNMFPMCQDLHWGNIQDWDPQIGAGSVDVVIGGPPCRGFSLARGLRFVDDPRNHLYKHFIRLVEQLDPTWIMMENVLGIRSIGKGEILQQIYEDFGEIGFRLDHRVINMADYGVPQKRVRVIFVGNSGDVTFRWPEPTHHAPRKGQVSFRDDLSAYVTIADALGDLPWPMGNYYAHRANSQMRGPRNRKVESDQAFTLRVRGDEFALCEEPATGAFVPGPVPEVAFFYRPVRNEFQKLMREHLPPWMEARRVFPVRDIPPERLVGTRRLTVREQARLQSFPDWFTFVGSPSSQSRQIGNAVPPLFARRLFKAIFSHLDHTEGS